MLFADLRGYTTLSQSAAAGDVTDMLHGFGLLDYNLNLVVDPGETKTVTFTAKKGVYPYYCTNFCSALHQEMQGYMIVR